MSDVERLRAAAGGGGVHAAAVLPVKSVCAICNALCDGVSCAGGGGQSPAPRRAY
jgi:hypothetical protein